MTIPPTLELATLLEESQSLLRSGHGRKAVELLCGKLSALRQRLPETEFRDVVTHRCRNHPLFDWIQQDPYSRRAYEKPRGYAGDAVMLDYIYSGEPDEGTSAIGRAVFDGTTRTSTGRSVIERRDRLAQWVDELAQSQPQLCVLSLAAGHLPEASQSLALRQGRIARWIAIDQDERSLETIRRNVRSSAIEPLQASVVDIVRGNVSLPRAHFAYSSGLFDYLSDRLAAKTIAKLFSQLLPGGRLVISNFHPHAAGRTFMEVFMDWQLIYRDEKELRELLRELTTGDVADCSTCLDSQGNIAYLTIVHR